MAMTTAAASPPMPPTPLQLSASRSPDTVSPIYPDRHIRPLPRARLLARLSPEQAASIKYPPAPLPVSPSLNFGGQDDSIAGRRQQHQQENIAPNGDVAHGQYLHHHPGDQHDVAVHSHSHGHCVCGDEPDSGDEEVEFEQPDYRYAPAAATPAPANAGGDKMLDGVQRRLLDATAAAARVPAKPPPPPASAASSADGYESFENTSNKKKRKIPLSGPSSTNQSQLSAEMASMGISASVDGANDDVTGPGGPVAAHEYNAPLPASTATGTGISGAGRGRYGRQNGRHDGIRRPLASSSVNSLNAFNTRLSSGSESGVKSAADAGIENTGGIISQAIKSAAQQGPLTPQDQSSLLRSVQNPTSSNPRTQFTFTMESESATKMLDQQAAAEQHAASYSNARASGGKSGPASMNTQGTQTNQSHRNGTSSNPPPGDPNRPPPLNPAPQPPPQADQPPTPSSRKPRRRPSKEYALAARRRRLEQEYTNYHHRPSRKDNNIWICEFCEYEDIFGVPPVALIRQYEVKDRIERKKAEEKRRLLEKAKAKGRKGRKGGKKNNHGNSGAGKNQLDPLTPAGAEALTGQPFDPALLPPGDGDVDDYYPDDQYDDEYEPDGAYGDDEYDPVDYAGKAARAIDADDAVRGKGGGGGGRKL